MMSTGVLSASDAYALDQELMGNDRFTLEQLMELAGLAVAEAIVQVLQEEEDTVSSSSSSSYIWILCGPGNNGGDGLVAARHLAHFLASSSSIQVVYPKRPYDKQPHYAKLVQQCEDMGIPIHTELPEEYSTGKENNSRIVLVDAMFGFSFRGAPRPPFDALIGEMKSASATKTTTTVAVDIPSGWSVDDDTSTADWMPDVLVSLTAPKLCAKRHTGRHFVGGRFLPPALAEKYNIRMPPYPGVQQVMELV